MNQSKNNSYLFTVDLLIEGASHADAVDVITKILTDPRIKDYKIQKGSDVGKWVEAVYEQMKKNPPSLPDEPFASQSEKDFDSSNKPTDKQSKDANSQSDSEKVIIELLEQYKAKGTLVRLKVLKGKGIHLNIPCRILNHDPSTRNVSVYHVDEKKVYLFHINEIEDITL
ncbi:hypothetical protein [Marinicrinis lubricantis]|uniref:Uncharacterized protein n=1 Tax=Marinicrinis lubricantis TaxID=2086470 RepID=A0ABW1IHS6_9BACL